jgi:hypothetical protein
MARKPTFLADRDRMGPYLLELARLLKDPTPQNVASVCTELERLGRG